MKIVGFVGMPGSGKSAAAGVAREMNIPVVVMGDVIREEAARRGLPPTDRNLGAVGNDLRSKEGPDAIATRCLAKIRATGASVVVVEGIRSRSEVERFRESADDFLLIEVYVPDGALPDLPAPKAPTPARLPQRLRKVEIERSLEDGPGR